MCLLGLGTAQAQDRPRYGGELIFLIPSEPPSYDGHREETFALIHPAAPHYSTLLRVDPTDRSGTKVIGDLAESWSISRDGRTYTFKLRRGVKFHDGSEMTSKDVKASHDKIIFPPAGVASVRKGEYVMVDAVQALKGRAPATILPCKDGHVWMLALEPGQWAGLAGVMGNPDWMQLEMFQDMFVRAQNAEAMYPLIEQWTVEHTKAEIMEQCQAQGCPTTAVFTVAEAAEHPHLRERGYGKDRRRR